MQRGWESGTGGLRPGTEMVGGVLLSRPRPYTGCSTRESVRHADLLYNTTISLGTQFKICTRLTNLTIGMHCYKIIYERLGSQRARHIR